MLDTVFNSLPISRDATALGIVRSCKRAQGVERTSLRLQPSADLSENRQRLHSGKRSAPEFRYRLQGMSRLTGFDPTTGNNLLIHHGHRKSKNPNGVDLTAPIQKACPPKRGFAIRPRLMIGLLSSLYPGGTISNISQIAVTECTRSPTAFSSPDPPYWNRG